MLFSLGGMQINSKHFALNVTIFTPRFVPLVRRSRLNLRIVSCSRGKSLECSSRWKYRKGKIGRGNLEGNNFVVSQRGRWEDPDDGNGSAYDDDSEDEELEEGEENDMEFESDWEEANDAATHVNIVNNLSASNYEEDLAKEVEELLSLEERTILQTNETPCLEKISTHKWIPLHTYALAGQIKDMDRLLEEGLDIDLVDKDGLTALHHAIIGKKEAVISHLLRKGANSHARDLDGATPLHYAVQVGAMQTVKLLIKYNVDVNTADNEGWTPLHVAIQSRNRYIAKVLLVNGADKTRRNKAGHIPLDLSLCYGRDFKSYDLTKLLKLVPADTNY